MARRLARISNLVTVGEVARVSSSAMHTGHLGGPSFRWELAGAYPAMTRKASWALEKRDLLPNFLGLLPQPAGGMTRHQIYNRKGGMAELFVLKYAAVEIAAPCLWHGTSPGGLRGVLEEGFRESHDHRLHGYSMPGLYTTSSALDALNPYAVNVRLTDVEDWDAPFVRIILLVQVSGPCVRQRGTEHIFRAAHVHLKEVHILRGYDLTRTRT